MKTIKIALDWTPNINHIGLFIAKELGFYRALGINLDIINPLDDNYRLTPGKKLELGLADFAIAPFETVISLNNKSNVVDAIAVYAILQEDISSIAVLKSSEIKTPKQLDGKIYASYKARYEDHIVKEMIKNNGGSGVIEITYPDKLGIWNTLLDGKADATWIFDNWEGIEAKTKGVELNHFRMVDFGIPYCYSPVIICKNSKRLSETSDYANFIKATQKGYLFAKTKRNEAVKILNNYLAPNDKTNVDIRSALDFTASYFGTPTTCGFMSDERISNFLDWLVANHLENKNIKTQMLFTNDLLG
jgi:ABC-type nitrate/sulfonate/bicarbonate transport system substrate-binding protein